MINPLPKQKRALNPYKTPPPEDIEDEEYDDDDEDDEDLDEELDQDQDDSDDDQFTNSPFDSIESPEDKE